MSMAVGLDTSQDYLVLDRLFPVTWRRANSTLSAEIAAASRTTINLRGVDAGGVLKQGDVWWDIPRALLSETPAPADTVTDADGVTWVALLVETLTLADFWRLSCRNLALAANLRELVTIEQVEWSKEASGARVQNWSLYRAAVPARVQRLSTTTDDDHDARAQKTTASIYLGEPIPVGRDARVRACDGTYWLVTGFRGQDAIGEPFVYDAEQTEWPSS